MWYGRRIMNDRLFLHDKTVVGNPYAHYLRFTVYMFLFWLLISQTFTVKFIVMGLAASFVVSWVCTPLFMIRNHDQTKKYFALGVPLIPFAVYVLWLLKELVLANIDVAQATWKKSLPIEPEIIRFQVGFDNPLAIALLANSITLTPGTITLNVDRQGVYEIHALTPGAAEGIRSGSMMKKVAKLYKEDETFRLLEG